MTDVFVEGAYAGRVVFVAGGSSGINLGIARRFAELGASVMLLSRTADKLQTAAGSIVAAGGTADWAAADVRDPDAVTMAYERCAERFGPIDVLISGAAGNFLAPVHQLSSNGFRTVVDIDLVGTYNVAKHGFAFLRRPGASIITITAPQAVRPMAEQAHAASAKAGVNMLTKVLALEWGPEGVRVNAISPGYIDGTEGTARLLDTADKRADLLANVPLGRLGMLADIADLALFLCSDNARYITGSIFECDGGLSLGPW